MNKIKGYYFSRSIFVSILVGSFGLVVFLFLSCTSKPDSRSSNMLDPDDLKSTKENMNALGNQGGLLDKEEFTGSSKTGGQGARKDTVTGCDFYYDSDFSPFYIEDQQVVVMNVKPRCKLNKKTSKIDRAIYYTLMGIPCSGEFGNMKIYGGAYAPKMISYSLDTGCRMKEPNTAIISSILKRKLRVEDPSVEFKLASYNPMEIHFWTLEGWQDSGIDPGINFRSLKIKSQLWPSMRDKGASVTANIYGSENSWGGSSNTVGATIKIKNEIDSRFSIQIENVYILTNSQIDEMKDQCVKTRKNKKECQDI